MEKALRLRPRLKSCGFPVLKMASVQTETEKVHFAAKYSNKIKGLNLEILDYNFAGAVPSIPKPVLTQI